MPVADAVTTTAIARREARNSIERMQFHLGRGVKGAVGVDREVRFLDALHKNSVNQGARAVGRSSRVVAPSFGQKAKDALSTGNKATVGRAKSSILADFSADSLQIPRDNALLLGEWIWQANASACATCLSDHGHRFTGLFVGNHPSCLCVPAEVGTPGLNPLSDQEIVSTMRQFGDPRYASDVERFANKQISREKFTRREAVNKTEDGKNAFLDHRSEGHITGDLPGNLPGQLADDIAGSQAGLADPTRVTTTSEHYAPDGVFSPERAGLHNKIVDDYLHAGLATGGEEQTLYFMGGGPASGKSSMVEALKNPRLGPGRKNLFIDSDEIKKFLPEYESMIAIRDPGAAAFVHGESSVISKRILNEGAQRRARSITLDGVGDRGIDDIAQKIKAARDAGYKIEANYATLDTNLAVKLAKNRARETGRVVPESYVRSAHADVSASFFDAVEARLFDVANLYDTSIQGKPKLIFRMVNGKGEILDEDLLKKFLAKGGNRSLDDVKRLIGAADDVADEAWTFAQGEVRFNRLTFHDDAVALQEKWWAGLSPTEQKVVQDYTNTHWNPVNSRLSGHRPHPGNFPKLRPTALDEYTDELNRILGKYPAHEERALSWRKVGRDLSDDLDAALASGSEVTHAPFASTTLDSRTAFNFTNPGGAQSGGIILEMESISCAYIGSKSVHIREQEWLIPSNTKFKVVGKEEVRVMAVDPMGHIMQHHAETFLKPRIFPPEFSGSWNLETVIQELSKDPVWVEHNTIAKTVYKLREV